MATRNTGYTYAQSAASEMNEWWGDIPNTPRRQSRPRRAAQNLPATVKQTNRSRVQRRKTQSLNKIGMYMAIALAICCVFIQVGRYARIAVNSKQISTLRYELGELENQKENLELRLSARENRDRLMNEALGLGQLKEATNEQTRVISLNREKTRQRTVIAANVAK